MQLLLDTAETEQIKEINSWGILDGVTTNPSLVASSGKDLKSVIKEITEITSGIVCAEVLSDDAEGMIKEAKELSAISENVVVKIPACTEGVKAVAALSKMGIKTNVTLVFSSAQAIMAARAGATYVSVFMGRLDDAGASGADALAEIKEIFTIRGIKTKVLAASVRTPSHVSEAALAGADAATIPYAVMKKMMDHPLTASGLERFKKDWAGYAEKIKNK